MSSPAPTTRQTTTLTMALQRDIREMRQEFQAYVGAASAISLKRKALAPEFMRLFKRFHRESGGTFIGFVRELDPNVPVDRSKYVNHPTYTSALYLRRLIEAPQTTPQHRKTVTPFRMLAAVMDTLVFYVRKHAPRNEAEVLAAFRRQSRWDERRLEELQTMMRKVSPLHIPGAPRLVKRIDGLAQAS